ncbi:MAG: glutathionylspermidine synthase [Bryobacterales bacterium]|nr:glutathionylspermidine synthase [Bryobacterales bacterium]
MRRIECSPRAGWQQKVEEAGLLWHSAEQPYWNESAFYEFTAPEIELLESATNELAQMSLVAAQHIVDTKSYSNLGIPESAIPLIDDSWTAEPPSLYGRFDLAYDGTHPPKLLEYNADTPTSLLEAAVVQWYWLEDVFPAADQFNSIHERLIARWGDLAPCLPSRRIDFCSMDDLEDGMTVTYLMDTARQAGLVSSVFPIAEIGWDGERFLGPGRAIPGGGLQVISMGMDGA